MFEYIRKGRVLVMGYPRCGSHIAAVMVAYDTGLCYAHEDRWGKRDPDGLVAYIETHAGFVTPAPGIADFARFGARDDVFILLVRRPADEIRTSSLRVKGGLARLSDEEAHRRIGDRYARWERCKPVIGHYEEIEYHELADHPLWQPATARREFTQVQIHPTLDYQDLVSVC